MRDILFKVKRTDNGEWVEGYYFCMVHDDGRHVHHFMLPLGADLSLGTPIEKIQVEVNPETLCQYTGLTDKNGKKIFEGDILNVIYSDQQGECHYTENYILHDLRNTSVIGWLDYANELEIVGNKFDNPELLEVEQ
ncbi:MAG: YopX family protein [Eubacterium sp.]